jgi:hypothetical protein
MLSRNLTSSDENSMKFPMLEKAGINSFFFFLFLFQVTFIFQGIDISDEGFHSTFYQQIFNNPQTVEYNFMYWLSGIIGGAWLKLFPEYGLIGLRLGGIMLNMLAVIATYRLLKNYINGVYLKLGLLIIVLLNGAAVKDINYNNISAFFFVIAIISLTTGLKKNKLFNLFLAGVFISLAAFSRLANISGLALMIVIVYSGFFTFIRSITYQVKQIFIFISGFILTTILVLGVMKIMGHFGLFMDSIKLLKDMAGSSETTHGITRLVKLMMVDYTTAVFKRALPVFIIVLFYLTIINQVKNNPGLTKFIKYFFSTVFILLLLGVVIMNETLAAWTYLIMLFAGISLISGFCIIIGKNHSELRIISLAGMIMTFSLVAGADYGISASGSTALWIVMPIAVDFFSRINSLKVNGSFNFQDNIHSLIQIQGIALSVNVDQLKGIWKWGIYFCMVILILHSVLYTYNDNPNRMKMIYPVQNAFLKGVFTTRERADAINELLEAGSKYIKRNDYVITYRDIPMYYTLTQTKPFIKNSWPSLYTNTQLDAELNKAAKENQILPPIIYQKVKTIPGPFWPDPSLDNSAFDIDKPKNEPIRKFINKYNYKIIWENIAFKIYIADINSASFKPPL